MIRFLIGLLILLSLLKGDETVKIATYNVENLFDLHYDGNEYLEYIPNTSWQWNRSNYNKKLHNIAKVITDINPDIIALQEIETIYSLKDLRKEIKRQGVYYQYYAFAGRKSTAVKVALLSKYPILYSREIPVTFNRKYRAILEVKVNIRNKQLYIFVNHWKSKSGPESRRIISAKALRKRLDELGSEKPLLITGDLNSHYEEYQIFKKKRKHNDTNGKTGINHTLQTLCKNKPATLSLLHTNQGCFYNLWYELPKEYRWNHIYYNKKETLDHMIISAGLSDGKGIDYLPGSFNKFSPKYLFKKRSVFRWQQSRKNPKHHLGKGYSDHLPIYATFILK